MKIRYKEVDIKRQADDNENNTRQDIEDFIYKKSFESFGERDLIVFGYYPTSPQISSAGQKKIDGIIFFRLDRLTRNTRDLYSLIDLFREKEVDFILTISIFYLFTNSMHTGVK